MHLWFFFFFSSFKKKQTVVVNDRTLELILLEVREDLESLSLGQDVRRLDGLLSRKEVVQLDSREKVRQLIPAVSTNQTTHIETRVEQYPGTRDHLIR